MVISPLIEDDPTLVTENFGLGVCFDPRSRSSNTNITSR